LAFGLEQPSHYDIFFLSKKAQANENVLRQFSSLRQGAFKYWLIVSENVIAPSCSGMTSVLSAQRC